LHSSPPPPPPKCGGGIPIPPKTIMKQTITPSTSTTNAPQKNFTTVWTNQQDNTINDKFSAIQLQFSQQHEHNIHFNSRISQLELTTKTIDTKIDKFLNMLFEQDTH